MYKVPMCNVPDTLHKSLIYIFHIRIAFQSMRHIDKSNNDNRPNRFTCDTTRSNMWHASFMYMWHHSFTYTFYIYMRHTDKSNTDTRPKRFTCDTTLSNMWHASFIYMQHHSFTYTFYMHTTRATTTIGAVTFVTYGWHMLQFVTYRC